MCAARRFYSEDEDAFIRANYLAMPDRDIAARLDRGVGSINDRLRKLGLRRYRSSRFTPAEDEIIRAAKDAGRSSVDVGRELGRDSGVIRLRAMRIGLGAWRRPLVDCNGYRIARIDQLGNGIVRRVPEHRAVMERMLGRRLTDSERVHHINARKRDNEPENLHLCANDAAHHRAHHSVTKLLAGLLERGAISFNRDKGIYELCEIRKRRPFYSGGMASAVA